MMPKSELRTSLQEVLDDELDGLVDPKSREELVEALVDRMQQDFEVFDDENEDNEELDESEDDELIED